MKTLSREAIRNYRLAVNHLVGRRHPYGDLFAVFGSGHQDGSPLSGLLSMGARLEGVTPDSWKDPSLAQVFGPRGAIYIVRGGDIGVFTRGLLPRDPERIRELEALTDQIVAWLNGRSVRQTNVVDGIPEVPGSRDLRWAATVGTLVPVWDTTDTIVSAIPAPDIGYEEARLELARRFFLHMGPAEVSDLQWFLAGSRADAALTIAGLGDELEPIEFEGRTQLMLANAFDQFGGAQVDPEDLRLLPPDDVYINRRLKSVLVPDRNRQMMLWPKAPPPGALLQGGEVLGTFRRRKALIEVTPWATVGKTVRQRTEALANDLPIGPGPVELRWKPVAA